MIKYNNNTIYDWNFGTSNLIKVYRNNAIVFYKVSGESPTPSQTPCFAVVDDISQYSDTEFEDVFQTSDGKWYKLNNLNQYEEYGVYGDGRTITYYEGKLTIDEETTPSPSRLPSGYTEVEYIENTGTSYINTELQLCSSTTNTFQVEAKLIANRIGSDTYQNIFACMSEAGEPYQGFTYRFFGSSIEHRFIPSNDGSFTQVSNEDGTTSVTASSTNGLTYSHTYPLTICCGLDSNRNPFRFTNTKVYTFTVTLNNELVADYVPAMRDSDSKYGLYDLVTDTFYVSPNGNNFIGGSAVTPSATTAICEFMYSGNSWVNVGEVSGSTASLPNVPFTLNYNAKNYDSNTNTLLKTSGQLADVDAVITDGTPTVGDGYLEIASGTRANISGYQSYFNRDNNNPNLTIISKQLTDGYECHMFANRDTDYNWMYRPYSDYLTLHGDGETGGIYVTTQPVIESVRIDSSSNYYYNNYTDDTASSGTGFNYGGANNGDFAMFQGYANMGGENFVGNFYWVYLSLNTLTDEQVQQVIAYNEGGGGQTEYPVYYSEMQDPPNNVSFSSMTEAESYECPWWGMTGIIDNTDYLFCNSNEWLTKYVYQEVSGDYICDSGNKYKKMQEWDRNVDGTISATTNYIMGDLIESASTDCSSRLPSGYTEVEYIENTGTSYLDIAFKPNTNTRILTEMQAVSSANYPRLFGAGAWNAAASINLAYQPEGGISNIHINWYGRTSWSYYTSFTFDYNKHTYDLNKNYLYRDETLVGSTSYTTSYQSTDNLGVFTYISGGRPSSSSYWGQEHFKGKMFSFKVYDNETLVRDLVPCIRDNDDTVGAYDIVNDVFYTVPTGYTTDKLIAGNPI